MTQADVDRLNKQRKELEKLLAHYRGSGAAGDRRLVKTYREQLAEVNEQIKRLTLGGSYGK